jgi:hypothetical protein
MVIQQCDDGRKPHLLRPRFREASLLSSRRRYRSQNRRDIQHQEWLKLGRLLPRIYHIQSSVEDPDVWAILSFRKHADLCKQIVCWISSHNGLRHVAHDRKVVCDNFHHTQS